MRPRTLALTILCILVVALVLRYCVYRYGWLPVTQEAVLKKAVDIRVTYLMDRQPRLMIINDAAERRELLGLLRVNEDLRDRYHSYRGWGGGPPAKDAASVSFTMPGVRSYSYQLTPDNLMGELLVSPAFFRKLDEIISRHEGRPIDVFSPNN
jgi:hypothetical protein